jgi:hypothetical protein
MGARVRPLTAIALAASLATGTALAADGIEVGGNIAVELVRTIGLPTALLLLVWWERRTERAAAAILLEQVRTEHARERGEWAARLEARHAEFGALSREAVSAMRDAGAQIARLVDAREEAQSEAPAPLRKRP